MERWNTEAVAGGVETALALYGVAVVHLVVDVVALLNGKAVDGLEVALTAEAGAAAAVAEAAAAAADAAVVADLVDANAGAVCGSFLISTMAGLKGLTEAGD